MKGFSILFILLSFNLFAFEHPSCTYFSKSSTPLFKISRSNAKEKIFFVIKTDENCDPIGINPIQVFVKDVDNKCRPPSFTYIRNNLGYKNYSDLVKSVSKKEGEIYLPKLNAIIKQEKRFKRMKFELFKSRSGCESKIYVENRRLRIYFNHIYQHVEYITPTSAILYKN